MYIKNRIQDKNHPHRAPKETHHLLRAPLTKIQNINHTPHLVTDCANPSLKSTSKKNSLRSKNKQTNAIKPREASLHQTQQTPVPLSGMRGGRNFFFPPQLRTPSTNPPAHSQSEPHDMKTNDPRPRNKSTHARGPATSLSRRGHTARCTLEPSPPIYVQNNGDPRPPHCTVLPFRTSYTVHSAGAERQRCV